MKRTIATPVAVLARGNPEELERYGDQALTPDEVEALRADEEAFAARRQDLSGSRMKKDGKVDIETALAAVLAWIATTGLEMTPDLAAVVAAWTQKQEGKVHG